jgi:hypothetical protein
MNEIGHCWNCEMDDVELTEGGVCLECDYKLEKQKETGRCSWCGHLILECDCD